MSSREEFEAWISSTTNSDLHRGVMLDRRESGSYRHLATENKWEAWQAATSTMEAKCEALAAENAGLKDFLHSRVDESICDKHIKTPATDAYRDELRAQGIEMAAKSDQFSMWVQQGLRSFAIGVRQGDECADELRKGVQS